MAEVEAAVHVRIGESGHELGQGLPVGVEFRLRLVGLRGLPLCLHALLDVAAGRGGSGSGIVHHFGRVTRSLNRSARVHRPTRCLQCGAMLTAGGRAARRTWGLLPRRSWRWRPHPSPSLLDRGMTRGTKSCQFHGRSIDPSRLPGDAHVYVCMSHTHVTYSRAWTPCWGDGSTAARPWRAGSESIDRVPGQRRWLPVMGLGIQIRIRMAGIDGS